MTKEEKQMIVDSQHEFARLIKKTFDTESGLKVLKFLKEDYVDTTAIGETPELTYYKLGQKELVQLLLRAVKDKEQVFDIQTDTTEFN